MLSTTVAHLRSSRGGRMFIGLICYFYYFLWSIIFLQALKVPSLVADSIFDDRNYTFPFTAYFREDFEKSFHSRCEKYNFVQRWVQKLENPGERYLLYVNQEAGVRNRGLGDRFGGLISATAMALRFDRQLLIKTDDLYKAFRPYHPSFSAFAPAAYDSNIDLPNANGDSTSAGSMNIPNFRWTNYENWTQYDIKIPKNDSTEFVVTACINNIKAIDFQRCSLIDGDLQQPSIKYRGNRAYLCYYNQHSEFNGHNQMQGLGIGPTADLYEAAGCMLRLALWPTERLWRVLDRLYSESLRFNTPTASTTNAAISTDSDTSAGTDRASALDVLSAAAKQSLGAFQVGMHFRCGDLSFKKGAAYDNSCIWDFGEQMNDGPMRTGNPYMTAICARGSYQQLLSGNFSESQCEAKAERYRVYNTEANLLRLQNLSTSASADQVIAAMSVATANISKKIVLGIVASDNNAAAHQMAEISQLPYIVLPRQSCHVEFDHSTNCHLFTISSWLALALSNVLVTQTIDNGAPVSGFSRYAGMYGLKQMPFRDARNCGVLYDPFDISHRLQENWIC